MLQYLILKLNRKNYLNQSVALRDNVLRDRKRLDMQIQTINTDQWHACIVIWIHTDVSLAPYKAYPIASSQWTLDRHNREQ